MYLGAEALDVQRRGEDGGGVACFYDHLQRRQSGGQVVRMRRSNDYWHAADVEAAVERRHKVKAGWVDERHMVADIPLTLL